MAELEYHPQRVEEALLKLVPAFWGKPRIASLLRGLIRESQRVEDSCFELFETFDVETAPEWALLLIGKSVGQPRLAFSLERFRLAIKAKALANRSKGKASDLLRVLNLLLGDVEYSFVEVGNATLAISALEALADEDVAVVQAVLPAARGAGIQLQFFWGESETFVWGDLWGSPEEWGTVRVL